MKLSVYEKWSGDSLTGSYALGQVYVIDRLWKEDVIESPLVCRLSLHQCVKMTLFQFFLRMLDHLLYRSQKVLGSVLEPRDGKAEGVCGPEHGRRGHCDERHRVQLPETLRDRPHSRLPFHLDRGRTNRPPYTRSGRAYAGCFKGDTAALIPPI